MARRGPKSSWTRTLQRLMRVMTRPILRAGSKAVQRSVRQATTGGSRSASPRLVKPRAVKRRPAKASPAKAPSATARPGISRLAIPRKPDGPVDCIAGMASALSGARRWYLYVPPGVDPGERLPLLMMLHGCGQDAAVIARSTRMNNVAARERFLVVYPEQDRLAHPQRCWNWYGIKSRRAHGEASVLLAAIDQVCLLYPVDRGRVAVAGLSAGASMGALLATRYPDRFSAVVMHSGVPPGAADSASAAIGAMRGRREPSSLPAGAALPPLLVIHGARDGIVTPRNGEAAARLWARARDADTATSRRVQRGGRYPMTVTDFKAGGKVRGRTVATLCTIDGLGHAWSGGSAGQRFSDARGPDASRMTWAFIARQFRTPAGC